MELSAKLTVYTSFNRYKKIQITPHILSDHLRLKLDFNNRNNKKPTNSWKLNNPLQDENWVKVEIRKKLKTSCS